jgi:NADP-dependent 3-hydroxy acid dehydrogenase YdfG
MTDRKIAAITGAASGIGRAVNRRLLAAGHAVAVIDRSHDALKAEFAGIDNAFPLAADVPNSAGQQCFRPHR